MKNTNFFGLTVFYPSWVKDRPDDQIITRAIKEYFQKEELTATDVRAIRKGYGNCIQLDCSLSTEGDKWTVEEVFFGNAAAA